MEKEQTGEIGSGKRISRPGQYEGYSEILYDGHQMISQYMTVRDGTRIAIDIFRPTSNGKLVETPHPVLWMHSPYNRRVFSGQTPAAQFYPGGALRLVPYGYVAAVADFRGLYASFGKNSAFNRGEWLDTAYWDAYDITEWFAEQSWCDGNVGMWGCSATGGSQLQAATSMPPHLKAIFPMSCEFDAYPFGVAGGMAVPKGRSLMNEQVNAPDRDKAAFAVDEDRDGTLLAEAINEHKDNINSAGYIPYRDSVSESLGEQWWIKSNPFTYLQNITKSGIAMYLAANWDEGATKYGACFTFNNVKNPAKLILGPEGHCNWVMVRKNDGFRLITEELRFFDYWLKGIQNGIMDEDPVCYYTYNAPEGEQWRTSPLWPLANEKRVDYYLGENSLNTQSPTSEQGKDTTVVDYDITPENRTEKGLVYETEPLAKDTEMTGHPVIRLWTSSTATDGDFIARIEDVAPDGTTRSYNMDGRLRASHRALHDAPYNNLGLPWHRGNEEDMLPLVPDEPAELVFDLYPISYIFKAGHRIRLVITFAEPVRTAKVSPAPEVTIYRNSDHPSYITLPIIES